MSEQAVLPKFQFTSRVNPNHFISTRIHHNRPSLLSISLIGRWNEFSFTVDSFTYSISPFCLLEESQLLCLPFSSLQKRGRNWVQQRFPVNRSNSS
mmetsp:Transcript_17325/g.23938  ORF Transcript_17325/g.23938 Transcript_17325/m.23938 type:complete len:96 (-) Transcript_17325:58-345(-)